MLNKSFLAFALLHVAVPAICAMSFGANPVWILGSLIFAIAIIRTLKPQSSGLLVTALCLLSGVIFALTIMLGTAYYMQGEGFNDSFFYHLNSGSLVIAARSYSSAFYPSLIGLVLAFLAPAIIHRTKTHTQLSAIPVVLIWALALFSSYPAYSLIQYEMSLASQVTMPQIAGVESPDLSSETQTDDSIRTEAIAETVDSSTQISPGTNEETASTTIPEIIELSEPKTGTEDNETTTPVVVKTEPKPQIRKNIILIYAESLESLYFETEIFGELLPGIKKLSTNAHRFTNMRQVRGTGWTIAGIVASQCGFPLIVSSHLASNSSMASVERPYPDEVCMADILSEQGYDTVYMGGAPLWFGGKGNFLNTHGYKRVFGDKELTSPMAKKNNNSEWGLYDDNLFALALNELKSLESSSQPYLLTLLTLDTHHPYGLSSKSCNKLKGNSDSMSNAVYCSDQLISQFITDSMDMVDMNDTIIVLFSDHLSLRNTLWDTLKAHKEKRRLTFMIFDHTSGSESGLAGTHLDVGPTVLEAAGLTDQLQIGAGRSIFTQQAKQVAQTEKHTPTLLKQSASAKETGVRLSKDDLSISVGDLTLRANESGEKFTSGMYLAVFDDDGYVIDAIYSDDFELLAKSLDGVFVVGVSVLENRPGLASYFYGRISLDGTEITQKALTSNINISPVEIIDNM